MISVRKAVTKDIDNIVKFLSSMGFKNEDVFTNEDYFVYYDNEALLGCGMAFAVEEFCIINNVLVDEKNRRNKIGTAIAKTILNYYERNGARIAISYGGCNAFCKSLGFDLCTVIELPDSIKKTLKKDIKRIYAVNLEGYFKGCC